MDFKQRLGRDGGRKEGGRKSDKCWNESCRAAMVRVKRAGGEN